MTESFEEELAQQIVEERVHQRELGYTLEHDRQFHTVEKLIASALYFYQQGEPIKALAMLDAAEDLRQYQQELNPLRMRGH